jgi:hypothetical protein
MKFKVGDIVRWHNDQTFTGNLYEVLSFNGRKVNFLMLKSDSKFPFRSTERPDLYVKLTDVELLRLKLTGNCSSR